MQYIQFIVELHRGSSGVVNGHEFTIHGLIDEGDRAAVRAAHAEMEFGRVAKLTDNPKINGVVEVKNADYMAVINVLTTRRGYKIQSENRMGAMNAGSDFRCLSYYMLVKEGTSQNHG